MPFDVPFLLLTKSRDSLCVGGGEMMKQSTDNGLLHELSITFDLSGVIKVAPWIRPIAELFPAAKAANNFRSFARRLFLNRLNDKHRDGKDNDIFHFLVSHVVMFLLLYYIDYAHPRLGRVKMAKMVEIRGLNSLSTSLPPIPIL
jgi:hypothetical protein